MKIEDVFIVEEALADLNCGINDAFSNENYEEAARLRDEISRLKRSS
jgi:protein-arginine kinase activator protein McsA